MSNREASTEAGIDLTLEEADRLFEALKKPPIPERLINRARSRRGLIRTVGIELGTPDEELNSGHWEG